MDNIDTVGIDKILNAIHDSNNTALAEEFYRHVFKTKPRDINAEYQDGTRRPEEAESAREEFFDFNQITEKTQESFKNAGDKFKLGSIKKNDI